MQEELVTSITPLYDKFPYHAYIVNFGANHGSVILSAQILLEIAEFVEVNCNTLKQEAQEDTKDYLLEETTEIPQIMPEWRYRTKDLLL